MTDAVQAIDADSNKHVPAHRIQTAARPIIILILNHRQDKRLISSCEVLVSHCPGLFLLDCPLRVWYFISSPRSVRATCQLEQETESLSTSFLRRDSRDRSSDEQIMLPRWSSHLNLG